jgi:hypothetical protein
MLAQTGQGVLSRFSLLLSSHAIGRMPHLKEDRVLLEPNEEIILQQV